MVTHRKCSSHTPPAPLSSQGPGSLVPTRPTRPSAGHLRRSETRRGPVRLRTPSRCIPAGGAPAARARSPAACGPAAGSLCPCPPPSAGTRGSWRRGRRTARSGWSRSPVGWRSPPAASPRRAGSAAKFCSGPNSSLDSARLCWQEANGLAGDARRLRDVTALRGHQHAHTLFKSRGAHEHNTVLWHDTTTKQHGATRSLCYTKKVALLHKSRRFCFRCRSSSALAGVGSAGTVPPTGFKPQAHNNNTNPLHKSVGFEVI